MINLNKPRDAPLRGSRWPAAQLSKVAFFTNELESVVPISICKGEELGTRDLKKLYRQSKEKQPQGK